MCLSASECNAGINVESRPGPLQYPPAPEAGHWSHPLHPRHPLHSPLGGIMGSLSVAMSSPLNCVSAQQRFNILLCNQIKTQRYNLISQWPAPECLRISGPFSELGRDSGNQVNMEQVGSEPDLKIG